MRFQILHESPGRVRLKALQYSMSMEQADLLEAWILTLPGVDQVTVHERLGNLIIVFHGDRKELYTQLSRFTYEEAEEEAHVLSANSRRINREYKEKMVFQVLWHYAKRLFLPAPLRQLINTAAAVPRIWLAVKTLAQGKLNVEVLDGVAISASLLTGDDSTAGSVRFLLGLGDTLDTWTHKNPWMILLRTCRFTWIMSGFLRTTDNRQRCPCLRSGPETGSLSIPDMSCHWMGSSIKGMSWSIRRLSPESLFRSRSIPGRQFMQALS